MVQAAQHLEKIDSHTHCVCSRNDEPLGQSLVVKIIRSSRQQCRGNDCSANHGPLGSQKPDNAAVAHLCKDESHGNQPSERTDVIFADLASGEIESSNHLRKDEGEAVVDTCTDAYLRCQSTSRNQR